MRSIILFIFLFLSTIFVFGQNKDIQIGSLGNFGQRYGGFYDYSDPEVLNIKVAVWGDVRYPGKYIIPEYSSVLDLLSLSGGPSRNTKLDELRLFRTLDDSSEVILKFNYEDLLWEDNLINFKKAPILKAGDILIVPSGQRYFFRDYLSMGLSIFSAIISLTILLINL